MTDIQRRVLQGLIDGKSYTEIAEEMGVTRQAVWQYAKKAISCANKTKRLQVDSKYQKLYDFIFDNYKSVRAFTQAYNLNRTTIYNILNGKHKPSANMLEKLSKITGIEFRIEKEKFKNQFLLDYILKNYKSIRAFTIQHKVSYVTIYNILHAKQKPSKRTIQKLQSITGMKIEELIDAG